jgi:hypothetical protein
MKKEKLNKIRRHGWVTVKSDGLIIEHNEYRYTIYTKQDFNELIDSGELEGVSFICSSSVDFPRDETDNQEIIEICESL